MLQLKTYIHIYRLELLSLLGLFAHRFPSSSLLTFFEQSHIELILCIFIDTSQILSDSIFWSKVLLCKVHSLLVGKNCSWITSQEFLLDSHIVIGNG